MTTKTTNLKGVRITGPVERPDRRHDIGAGKYGMISDHLRKNPGKWFTVQFDDSPNLTQLAGRIRRGAIVAFRDGKFDASIRDGVLYVKAVA